MVVREILDKAGAASCCKTSGKRGLHVYVPLGQKYTFPQVKLAADILARLIHRQSPATTTLDSRRGKREGRIYLDTTRNARGQAVAVAYCARPHPGATVSAPLKWSEVRRGLDPSNFTIKTMRVGAAALCHIADLLPHTIRIAEQLAAAHGRGAGGRRQELREHSQRRRVPRAIGTDEPADPTGAHGEIHATNRLYGAFVCLECPCQSSCFDHL